MFNAIFNKCPTLLQKTITSAYFRARSITANGFHGIHSLSQLIEQGKMKVDILPALTDNYMYLIICEDTREAAVVDPVDPDIVLSAVKKHRVRLTSVLTTHHHWDHAGGNETMCKLFDNLKVFGGDKRIGALTHVVSDKDKLVIGKLEVDCFRTPGHTDGHVCYLVVDKDVTNPSDRSAVFTGDTLFVGGCGRFFEGTAEQMYGSLIDQLSRQLPDETKVYCGHEYTEQNLQFAQHVEPHNDVIKIKIEKVRVLRENNLPTVPSTILEEKLTNPFMRVCEESVMKHAKKTDPIETMAAIRLEKDTFKAKPPTAIYTN